MGVTTQAIIHTITHIIIQFIIIRIIKNTAMIEAIGTHNACIVVAYIIMYDITVHAN
jgi:hypothetical protein